MRILRSDAGMEITMGRFRLIHVSSSHRWDSCRDKFALISIGTFPAGVIAIGLLPRGILSIGLVPVGAVGVGMLSFGILGIGLCAFGVKTIANYGSAVL